MPNGRVHTIACIATAASVGPALYFSGLSDGWFATNCSMGALLGIMISPDLDIMENGNISMQILRTRSEFSSKLWQLFWWPYAKVSRHRGISHWPIIGTLLRCLYLLIPILVVFIAFRWHFPIDRLIPAYIGLTIADFVHTFLDVIF